MDKTIRVPAGSNEFRIPAILETGAADGQRHGGVLAYYVGEYQPATASSPSLTQVTMNLNTLVILQYVTLQLLQDANITAIDQLINRQSALELLWQQNQAVIDGSAGNMKGILNQPSLVTVTQDSNDSGGMFSFADLANMQRAMYPPSRNNAIWLMNPEAYSVLLQMTFPNAAATSTYPAWSLTYDAHEQFPLRLYGREVIECLNLPELGLPGDIIYADLSQLYTYERSQVQVDMSEHLQFNTLQVAYRWVNRFTVGSPWLQTYASKDGHYLYSPFVVLESRGLS